MLQEVPQKFTEKFPDLSIEKQNKYFNKYLNAISKSLLKRLPFMNDGYTYISLKRLLDESGEFNYKKKRYYIYNEFKDLYAFYYVVDKGSNLKYSKNTFEKNSKVKLMNHRHIDMLIDSNDTNELVTMFYGDLTPEKLDELLVVDVDMTSLNNFIGHCKVSLNDTTKSEDYTNKIRKNYYQARYVKIISEFFYSVYDKYCLPMIAEKSDYGRIYYKGINIQNMGEEVRRAVIGDCHQYDLSAAVYAIKLMLAKDVLNDQGISHIGQFTYTKDYIDRKKAIRKELVDNCMTTTKASYKEKSKYVKQALTAIGFGAKLTGNSWLVDNEWQNSAINEIIKNKTDREQFINNDFVKNFIKEQSDMTKLIVNHHLKDEEFLNKITKIKSIINNNGRIRKNQVMVYMFQHIETMIMETIKDLAGTNVYLVHDAMISKEKITNDNLLSIKLALQNIGEDLSIEYEYKTKWTSVDPDRLDDDDPRDIYVRKQIEQNSKIKKFDVEGNYNSYESTTQYQQLEEEDYYE